MVAFNDPMQWYLGIVVFAYVLVLGGPLGEEIGWRGYALDRLQPRFTPMLASVLLGVAWGVWHLPLFFSDGAVQQQIPIVRSRDSRAARPARCSPRSRPCWRCRSSGSPQR